MERMISKPEIRIPEIRKKSEARRPKIARITRTFDFRISYLGLFSGLGFRPFGFRLWVRFVIWLRLANCRWSARSNGRFEMDGRQEWVRLVKSRPLGLRPSGFFRISTGRFSDFPEWVRFVIPQNFEPRSERWLCFAESLVPVPRDQRLVRIADSLELLGAWAIP